MGLKGQKRNIFQVIGPGLVVAATGIGAGDMIAAAVAGAKYGTVLIWAALVGAFFKYYLNEGIARWQLSTGSTLLDAWLNKFHRAISVYFIIYLFLWSFIVAAALIAACGLAAHAILPALSVKAWGIIHSLLALVLVFFGRYVVVEKTMKFFIALMFLVVITAAILVRPDWGEVITSLISPGIPGGAGKFILGVIGGVGGSVTLLSYGYWIREKRWIGEDFFRGARIDLKVAYGLTGLFGAAVMIIAAGVKPEVITGNNMVIGLAGQLGAVTGPFGKWIFLVGFWGAVFSSMLGVWQGVPYLFADYMRALRDKGPEKPIKQVNTKSKHYRGYLFYLGVPPIIFLFVGKPVWIVIIYSVVGAFFMPFLAASLLYLNNFRDWVGKFKYNLWTNLILSVSLLLFLYLCVKEIIDQLT